MDKDGTGTGTFQGSEDNRPSIVRGLQHGLGASVVHFLLRPSRLGAALLLIGVIAGLVWGDARQPPRNYPFEKVDAATWLRGRELHPAFRQTPVVPAGTDVRFVSRSVGAETKPCCGLTVTEDHIYEFIDKQTVPHVVAQLYRDGITGHVFALTTSGDVYAFSAENPATWSKLSHLEAASQPRPPLSASASDLVTFATLPSPVNSVAVSPDGQQVVAGTADGVLHCLPYSGGAENWTVSAHRSPILRVVWSHDGSRVATASSDGTAKVWDTHRDLQHVGQLFDALVAKSTITLRHSAAVNVVAFSSDDQYLLTASDDGTVRVWNFRADTLVRTIPAAANDAAFSPDGKRIAIALKGGGVEQWSLVDGRQIGAINEPVGPLTGVAYSPGGSELAAVSASGFTFLWDANTGMASVRAPGFPTSNRYLAYSPRGDRLVTASSAGELRLWFKPIPDVGPETSGTSFPITSMAFSADGSTMVLGGSDNTLRKWTVPRGGLPFASAIATDRSGALWVAGPGGYLARSPDGINWNQLAWGVQDDLIALKVIDFDRLAVLTARNHLLLISRLAARTGDSSVTASSTEPINGASLDIQDHDLSKYADKDRLLTFFTANEKSAWVAGTGGKILYTDDLNSENWTSLFSAPDLRISDLVVESTGVGWAVGTLGGRQTLIAANHATGVPAGDGWRELPYYAPRWFYLIGLPLLLVALGLNLRAWAPPPPQPVMSIEDLGTSDEPLKWSDPDAARLKPLARNLSRFLRNINTRPPLTLSIAGRWGSGKSSLMQLLMEDLRYYGGRAIWFNAWHHHDEDDLLAALFSAIRRDAAPDWWSWSGLLFRLRLIWIRLHRLLFTLGWVAVFGLVLFSTFELAVPHIPPDALSQLSTAITGGTDSVGAVIALILAGSLGSGLAALALLWLHGKLAAMPANPAKLAAAVARSASIGDLDAKLAFRSRFGVQFGQVCEALLTRVSPGLIIFIDDLDRCQPDDTLKVLEAVNYLVSAGPCTVVLGMDRRQVEHSVGYGFRDLVAAVPPEELVVAADETTNEAARQRAFARRYLEKLINIEVEVPRLHDSTLQTMFGGSANADESALGDGASWLRTSKRVARESVQIARVGLVTFALGIGLAWAMDHFPSTGPTSPAPSRPAAAAPAPSSAAKSPTSKPTGSEEPAAIAFATVQEKSVSPTSEIPSDRRWVWWGPSTLVFGIAVLFGAALLVHRKPVIRDSDEFRKALEAVRPLFKAMNSTPRTIKRYQNRMRYLAASGRRGLHEPDGLDSLLHWVDQRLSRKNRLVPSEWFEEKSDRALRESALILLGAIETFVPSAFADRDTLSSALRDDAAPSVLFPAYDAAWREVRSAYEKAPLSLPTVEEVRRYPA